MAERARTPRDDLWDVLAQHFGEPRMDQERAAFGKVVGQLLAGAATPDETTRACEYVLRNFDSPSVHAVPKWFSVAINAKPKLSAQEQALELLRDSPPLNRTQRRAMKHGDGLNSQLDHGPRQGG